MKNITQILENPLAKQLLIVGIGVLIILLIMQLMKSAVKKNIDNTTKKYHAIKFVSFFRYVAISQPSRSQTGNDREPSSDERL